MWCWVLLVLPTVVLLQLCSSARPPSHSPWTSPSLCTDEGIAPTPFPPPAIPVDVDGSRTGGGANLYCEARLCSVLSGL